MGRTTPSYRVVALREYSRIIKIINKLPENERKLWIDMFQDLGCTLSLYSDVEFTDPLEPIIVHLFRKLISKTRN